jgi:hypothetical protein
MAKVARLFELRHLGDAWSKKQTETAAEQLANILAHRATKELDDQNQGWNSSNPKWEQMYSLIKHDIAAATGQLASQAQMKSDETQRVYVRNIAPKDLDALLAYYESPLGQRDARFSRSLDEIVAEGSMAFAPKLLDVGGNISAMPHTEARPEHARLIRLSSGMVEQRHKYEQTKNTSGLDVLAAMEGAISVREGERLNALLQEYRNDIDSFEDFRKSPVGNADAHALEETGKAIQARMVPALMSVVSAWSSRRDAWQQAYRQEVLGTKVETLGRNVTVAPRGEFASINTGPTILAMNVLRGGDETARRELIEDIKTHSDRYPPPVFFALSETLWTHGQRDEAFFWFSAGRLRGRFDATRCADATAREAVDILVMGMPPELRKAQFDDVGKLKGIVLKVVKWDEETPYHYDHRWINLHGMGAMTSSLDEKQENKAQQLSLPESEWPSLAKQERQKYLAELNEAIEELRKSNATR